MRFIRLVSDIHLDFDVHAWSGTRLYDPTERNDWGDLSLLYFPPDLYEDLDSTLVLAGDLWQDRKWLTRKFPDGESWGRKVARKFKYVVVVLGNHDYWGANFTLEAGKTKLELKSQGLDNVFLLDNDVVVLDQVKFLGGTLWTDFDRGSPLCKFNAPKIMEADYSRIRKGSHYGKLFPDDVEIAHHKTRKFIFQNAKRDEPDQRVVVVTHMAPSHQSIDPMYRDDLAANPYYYSSLDREIADSTIDLWFHGHMHTVKDYMIEQTRVVCMPRGYRGHEIVEGFDPRFRIEL